MAPKSAVRVSASGSAASNSRARAGERPDPAHQAVLPVYLEAVARHGAAPLGAAARRVPFLLRSTLPDPPARPVGGRNRVRVRATAVGGGLRAHHGRRPELRG